MKNTDNFINYVEFHSSDLEKTKAFYAKAFGWKFTDYGPDYCAFSDCGLEGGFEYSDVRPATGALIVLFHSNLEKALENVIAAGGSISREIFDFPGGRRFHFMDPSGNELAVWSDM